MANRLADAAAERLSSAERDEPEMTVTGVMRVLARIARTGKPGDRLRAAELLGRQLGMFREQVEGRCLTLEDLMPKSKYLRRSPTADAEIVAEGSSEGA